MTNPNDPASGVPDPAANRAAWQQAHPGAQPLTQEQGAEQVASQIGAGAPPAAVSQETLGGQMAGAGARPGVGDGTYEDAMDALMAEVRRLSGQVDAMAKQERIRQAEHVAQFGEPVLQSTSAGLRDKLQALIHAHPGGGQDHFGGVLKDAGDLVDAASRAISQGANDMGPVLYLAGRLDQWFTRGHHRTAPGTLRHVDLSAAEQDLQRVIDEAHRLGDTQPGHEVVLSGATSA